MAETASFIRPLPGLLILFITFKGGRPAPGALPNKRGTYLYHMKLASAHRVRGRLRLPGDKSISHRAALIAALAQERSEISNFSTARDCASTLSCLRDLGVSIEPQDGKLHFPGNQELLVPPKPLDCGNSGSTMRILAGVLAAQDLSAELIGDDSLTSRPMRRIIEP